MAGWGDTGGSSGGSSGGGWGGGGGATSTPASKKKTAAAAEKRRQSPDYPKTQLVRSASRIINADAINSDAKAMALSNVESSIRGYSKDEIRRLGLKAGLPDSDIRAVQAHAAGNQQEAREGINSALDYLSRPQQAVLGALTEGPGGAVRGFTGEQTYTPVQSALRYAGQSKKEAAKTEAGLSPWLTLPANVGGSIVTDPATWVTFGTSAGAEAATRTAAGTVAASRGAEIAADAAAVASHPIVKDVAQQLASRGLKALSKDEAKALPRSIRRGVRRAPGGMRVAGHAVPGTVKANRLLESLTSKVMGGENGVSTAAQQAERLLSPRGGARQLSRSGEAPAGFAEDLENLAARFHGRSKFGSMQGARRAAHAVKGLDEEGLASVRRAMEDPSLVETLGAPERSAFDALDSMRSDVDAMRVGESRVLRTGDEIDQWGERASGNKFDPLIERSQNAADRVEAARYRQSGRWANAEGRRQAGAASDVTQAEEAAVKRATEREAALQGRDVAEQSRAAVRDTKGAAVKARTVERTAAQKVARLERGAKDLERELDSLPSDAERLGPLSDDWDATLEDLDRARSELADASARRAEAEQAATRAIPMKAPPVPPRTVPKPGISPSTAKAGESAAREQMRLHILDNLTRSAEGRTARIAAQKADYAAKFAPLPLERRFPRFLSDEAQDLYKKGKLPGSGRPDEGGLSPQLMGRQEATKYEPTENIRLPGAQLPEGASDEAVKEAARGGVGAPRFELNPAKAMARDYANASRDTARVQFVDELSKIHDSNGVPFIKADVTDADRASGAWVEKHLPIREATDDGITRTQPVLVRKEISADFDRLTHVLTNDDTKRYWLKWLDKFNGLWKAYATSVVPFGSGFTIRNAEGNLLNGFLLGNTNPRWLIPAARLQRRMASSVKEFGDALAGLSSADRAIAQEAVDHGALETGFFSNLEDLGKMPTATGKVASLGRSVNPLSQDFVALRVGRGLNEAVENNARLAMFMGQRAKGLSAPEAARMVRRYLFDYSDLTNADRAIKHVIPFWTWTRKNTPLQLSALLHTPGKIAAQVHALQGVSHLGPGPDENTPQWMLESNGVILPAHAGENKTAWIPDTPLTSAQQALQPLASARDILQKKPGAVSNLMRDLFVAAGPGGAAGLASAGGQVAAGKDIFTQRPFYPGERVQTPVYLKPLEALGVIGDTIPREQQYLLEAAMPGLTKVRGGLPTDPGDESKQTRRLLSMLTGQSVWPIDRQAERSEAFRRVNELDTERRSLADQGAKIPAARRRKKKVSAGGFGK